MVRSPAFRLIFILFVARTALGAEALLLKDASFVDPVSQTVSKVSLVLRAGKIAQILPMAPAHFLGKTLDLAGKYVLPALTDTHTHTTWNNAGVNGYRQPGSTEEVAKLMLYAGVTSFLDLFADEDTILKLRNKQRAGKLGPGADIYAAGPMFTCTHGHGTGFGLPVRIVDSPADARRQVKAFATKHPDVIKVIYDHAHPDEYPSMDKATMEAVIQTANQLGIKTVVHIGTWQDAKEATLAGVTVVTHLYGRQVIPDDVLAAMREHKTYSVPTMAYQVDLENLREDPSWLDSPLLAAITTPELMAGYRAMNIYYPYIARVLAEEAIAKPNDMKSLKKLGDAGIRIMTGTDSGAGDIGTFHGYSVHREMKMMVDAGLSPWMALAAATTLPNEFLGHPSGVRVGSPANLIVLSGNPVTDIRNTQAIEMVIQHGRIVDRPALVRGLASTH